MKDEKSARDAALNAARYRAQQASQEPLPVDEYAEATGMAPVAEPKTPLQFYAQDEAWEVANSVLDEAFARGDFDNLALAGQNIDHLTSSTDPDWWLKSMMHREKISGLGPPALTLRVEDEHMDKTLDKLPTEAVVREHIEDFNQRVIEARRQLLGGPPVITSLREPTAEVLAWQQRRHANAPEEQPAQPTRRWWRRRK
ncbi:DnaJ family domain-containing protein [Glutamicibacter sp. NPDC087344]|uniref:DnaJ family domain-containing protein n=1 Tax=Glutamicibacter sp. NPDC087344 TaxID=3363994 RepID=UPI0038296ABD